MSKEPIRIDLLIIKEENAEKVMKNEIGHIMRKYNVLEYKGPVSYTHLTLPTN